MTEKNIYEIVYPLFKKYDMDNHHKIKLLFEEVSILHENGINALFCVILRSGFYTLETIKYMVDLGADPRYDNDEPFIIACGFSEPNILAYFVDEVGVDINVCNDRIYMVRNSQSIYWLLNKGMILNDEHIISLLQAQDNDIFELIISNSKHNVSLDRIIKIANKRILHDLSKSKYLFLINTLCKNECLVDSTELSGFISRALNVIQNLTTMNFLY